jgi:hypothetical protein
VNALDAATCPANMNAPGYALHVYKSQISVIEQAIETAAPMLGTDKSRGYRLEMICADFLAGARLDEATRRSQLDLTLPQILARRTAAGFPRKPA